MARIRSIKPDITLDEELAELGFAARYFFLNLWCHCDREGRCEDRPKKLQALILPWDPDIDVDILLNELSPKFVIRYEVAGKHYIQVRNFMKHQRPHVKELPSEIPMPNKDNLEKPGFPRAKTGKARARTLVNGNGNGNGNGVVLAPKSEPQSESPKPKELTPIQKVIRGFKEAKGIDSDNKDWDRKFFARHTRPAKELLVAFNGDPMAAIAYILAKGAEWEHLPDWGLEAIVKVAAREYNRIGGENGLEHKPMDAAGLGGPRSTHSFTQSRALVGGSLRAIESAAIHPEESSFLGSADDDSGCDEN